MIVWFALAPPNIGDLCMILIYISGWPEVLPADVVMCIAWQMNEPQTHELLMGGLVCQSY